MVTPGQAWLPWDEIDRRLGNMVAEINKRHVGRVVRLWGIPRGGQVIAGLLRERSNGFYRLADSPPDATICVDDIIDSGETARKMKEHYGLDTIALVDKTQGDKDVGWVVFPWEGDAVTDHAMIVTRFLQAIGEEPTRPGLLETPRRVVDSWQELYSGYNVKPEDVLKWFDDDTDEMVIVRNIAFSSSCEHHLLPFHGTVDIGYVPNGKIVGVSKLARLVEVYARRLQVQERLARQIGEALAIEPERRFSHEIPDEDHDWQIEDTKERTGEHTWILDTSPLGVAVHIKGTHLCMSSRGIKAQGSHMETNFLTGVFKTKPEARAEFMKGTK